ncbi:Chymotrypsin-2, partial [Cyphomyrmex costatus]
IYEVVGGIDAPDGKYPYQVSLKDAVTGKHFCGGAIVSQKYVITAAHCLDTYDSTDILVDVGSTRLYCPVDIQRYRADKLILYPHFNKTLHMNDIGLIRLTKDIRFSETIKPIALISYDRNFTDIDFIVTGWGELWWDGPTLERLQQTMLTGFSHKKCALAHKDITDNHICTFGAWYDRQKIICHGDSGGPLTFEGALAGIVSFGILPCISGFPVVSTRVYNYREWVNEYINTSSNQQSNIILGLFTMYLSIYLFL